MTDLRNVAFMPSHGRTSPTQFGPIKRTPLRRAMSRSSVVSAIPLSPASPNPADKIIALRMLASPHCCMMPATVAAGVAITARSISILVSSIEEKHCFPRTWPYLGFIGTISPWKPPSRRFAKSLEPTLCPESLAPKTATDRGSKSGSSGLGPVAFCPYF